MGEEGEERKEGGAGIRGNEFDDVVRDTVGAEGFAHAEGVDRFVECIPGCHVGECEGGVPAGFDDEAVWVVRVFPWRDGKFGWGSAGEFGVEVRVD
jgi:hypothetical protein